VPLLARALARAGVEAPIVTALAGLISGELPLEQWVERVRTTTPPPARFDRTSRWWRRLRARWTSRAARRARS
jgi:glycerol-3-phosphate dehydrogenase (NAD(P)+)